MTADRGRGAGKERPAPPDHRENSEYEQALFRLLLGGAAIVYLASRAWADRGLTGPETRILWLCAGFSVAALGILASIIRSPAPSPVRRVAGMVLDMGSITAGLHLDSRLAGPLFVLYLWVIFGNGFRFGRRYLAGAATLAVVGFGSVIATRPPVYQMVPEMMWGILAGLVLLPLYVSALLQRLNDALGRARAASEAKSRFLANISHELRTPLNAVLGLSELLVREDLPPEPRRHSLLIRNAATNLLGIIDDVLDFSRIEAHRIELRNETFDLRGLVDATVAMFSGARTDGQLVVVGEVDTAIPEAVQGDPVRLAQVLNNLVGNAVKFTPRGEVRVCAARAEGEGDRIRVRFEVQDTGIGIPEEALERVFDPFCQADASTTREHGGTGLGLSIARSLVVAMGGSLEVSSRAGEGTVFRFELAFSPADPAGVEPPADPGPSERLPGGTRILLVEDNPMNRDVAERLMAGFGCDVVRAANGEEAVAAFRRERVDLVLMDCQMPVMDGYAATREIRRIEADRGGKRVPVVALTAHATPEDMDRCIASGMDDYLAKPYRGQDLFQTLHRWLVGDPAGAPGRLVRAPRPSRAGPSPDLRKLVHTVNNLLMVITGNAELLIETPDIGEAGVRKAAERILEAAEKAVGVLRKRTDKDGNTAPPG